MRGRTRFTLTTAFASALATAAVLASAGPLHPASASAATLPEASTAILSGAPSLFDALPAPVASAEASPSSVSQNGRFVAFQSRSDGLFEGDDDDVSNVYVDGSHHGRADPRQPRHRRRRASPRTTSAISRPSATTARGWRSPARARSTRRRTRTRPSTDVYVRDLASSTTTLVSRAGGLGAVGDGPSSSPAISETGEYVAFESEAKNLDPSSTQSGKRVYRRQLGGGNTTVLVSRRSPSERRCPGPGPRAVDKRRRQPDRVHERASRGGRSGGHEQLRRRLRSRRRRRHDGAREPRRRHGRRGQRTPPRRPRSRGTAPPSHSSPRRTSSTTLRTRTRGRTSTGARSRRARRLWSASPPAGRRASPRGARRSTTPATSSRSSRRRPRSIRTTRTRLATRTSRTSSRTTIQVASRADGTDGAVVERGCRGGRGQRRRHQGRDRRGQRKHRAGPRSAPLGGRAARPLRAPQRTYPVSRPAGNAPFVNEGGFAYGGALSADGRFAVFVSGAPALGLPDGVQVRRLRARPRDRRGHPRQQGRRRLRCAAAVG